jgi:hypothetical protein
MGWFDGIPILEQVEDGAGEIVDTGIEIIKEAPGEIVEFAQDPVGYVEKELSNLSLSSISHAVTLGLDTVAEGVAREAGLGQLVDGVKSFVDVASDVLSKIVQFVKCACWVENPAFWSIVAGLFAARSTGLIKEKDDCYDLLKRADFLAAIGGNNIPLLAMMPCAIEAAFLAPLPPTGTVSGAQFTNIGEAAANNIASSSLGKSAEILGNQSLESLRNAARPAAVGSVCRSENKIDIMVVRGDGLAVTAAWEQLGDQNWRGWWPVSEGMATPDTSVTAVSRSKDKLDIFMVGMDGRVWTAAWEPGDTAWRGWWPIGNLVFAPMTPINCVSRSENKLDVFIRGADKAIYSAAWEADNRGWRYWWRIC